MTHVTDAVEDEEVLNNVNSKMLECIEEIEELVTAIAATHSIIQGWRRGGNTNLIVPSKCYSKNLDGIAVSHPSRFFPVIFPTICMV
jgi:hypothetical protein